MARIVATRRSKLPQKFLFFDGSSESATSPISVGTSFSVAFWIVKHRLVGSNNDRIVDCCAAGPANGFTVIQGTGNKPVRFEVYAGGQTAAISTDDLELLRPYFIVCTFTTNSAKIYQDGVLKSTDTSCSMGTVATTFTVGKRATAASNFFKGGIGKLMFFNNKVLNQTEIDALYYGGTTPSGATAIYTFDNDVSDATGNGNTMTLTGGRYRLIHPPKLPPRGSNYALNFANGGTNRVTVPTNAGLTLTTTGAFSWFAKVYITNLRENVLPWIIQKGSTYMSWMGDQTNGRANNFAVEVGDGSPAVEYWSNTQLQPFTWYDLGFTFSSTLATGQLYLNGIPEQTTAVSGPFSGTLDDDSAADLYMGNSSGADRNCGGMIRNLRQYNVTLTDAEMLQLSQGVNVTRGLVGKWDTSAGSGTTIADSSGSGNNGSLVAANWVSVGNTRING